MVYRNSAKRAYEEGQRQMAKTKNPIAKALRTPRFRKRVTRDKSKYNRKRKKVSMRGKGWGDDSFFDPLPQDELDAWEQ